MNENGISNGEEKDQIPAGSVFVVIKNILMLFQIDEHDFHAIRSRPAFQHSRRSLADTTPVESNDDDHALHETLCRTNVSTGSPKAEKSLLPGVLHDSVVSSSFAPACPSQ